MGKMREARIGAGLALAGAIDAANRLIDLRAEPGGCRRVTRGERATEDQGKGRKDRMRDVNATW